MRDNSLAAEGPMSPPGHSDRPTGSPSRGPADRVASLLHLSRRGLWILVGVVFVAIAAIGAVLPLIPTTGPLIVAAWAFAKGSPALHRWLVSNRLFGPLIVEWETFGIIRPRAKLLALGSMGLASAWMAFGADMHWALAALGIGLCAIGAGYVASRPSGPAQL